MRKGSLVSMVEIYKLVEALKQQIADLEARVLNLEKEIKNIKSEIKKPSIGPSEHK